MKQERAHVVFHGEVQGIGFRATSALTLRKFDVTGYVLNRPDGTVYMVVEGLREEIERALDAVQHSRLSSYIRHADITWGPARGDFIRFEVQYG